MFKVLAIGLDAVCASDWTRTYGPPFGPKNAQRHIHFMWAIQEAWIEYEYSDIRFSLLIFQQL
jgi:hypothetical protein